MKTRIFIKIGILCGLLFANAYASAPFALDCPPVELIRQTKMRLACIYDVIASYTIHSEIFQYNNQTWETMVNAVIWDSGELSVLELTNKTLQVMPLIRPENEEYCSYYNSDYEEGVNSFLTVNAYRSSIPSRC